MQGLPIGCWAGVGPHQGTGLVLTVGVPKAHELIERHVERRQPNACGGRQRTCQQGLWRRVVAAQPTQGDVQTRRADDRSAAKTQRLAHRIGLRTDALGIPGLGLNGEEKIARVARGRPCQARNLRQIRWPTKERKLVCHTRLSK